MLVRIKDIKLASKWKPAGYLSDCFAVGVVDGDYLRMSRENYDWLYFKYRGWGDRVHDFLKPFVRYLDRVFGTRLGKCQACASRRAMLNQLTFRQKVTA
jgi:hypothetical protein